MKFLGSRSWKLLICLALALAFAGQSVYAKEREVKVYFEGQLLLFEDQPPVIREGITLVPFRALFETLGFKVTWDETARKAAGTKEGLEIELTVNSETAYVNGSGVKLLVPARIIKGRTMIPLRFVSENSGFEVSYEQVNGVAVIGIDKPGEGGGTPSDYTAPEPYVLKGRAFDSQGKPLQGALITADNLLLYNSNAQAVTDADGYYRIPLGMLAATYHATADYTSEFEGTLYTMELTPDNDSPFAGNTGAIRNFAIKKGALGVGGFVLFYMMDLIHPQNPTAVPPDREDVIMTLRPVGKQPDGSEGGEPVVGHGVNTPDGFGLHGVPIGKYEISAVYAPEGMEPVPMLVRIVSRGKDNPYEDSVTTTFSSITSKIYSIELELKLDPAKLPPLPEEPDAGNWWEEPVEWEW